MELSLLVVQTVQDVLQVRYLRYVRVKVGKQTDIEQMSAIGIALLVNWLYFLQNTVLLDFLVIEKVLEKQLVVP